MRRSRLKPITLAVAVLIAATAVLTGALAAPGVARAASGFQPSAPYYATFFYPWYKSATCDGSFSYWQDHSNCPPRRWYSHYLPDLEPSRFDPHTELYSSFDYGTFKWEVGKMAEARQEVAISSWFGRGTKQDAALKTYLSDFMGRADNPYPNLRFALYYEKEGFGDPSVSRLVADLKYIQRTFARSPYCLKVNGKPVVFVYSSGSDGVRTSRRWKRAVTLTGKAFYYVLKVHAGYRSDPYQPSSWHQYAPSSRFGSFEGRSSFVSPGFWKDGPGESVRLPRNVAAFRTAARHMVAAHTPWNLVETWNEWGEGTSVEPGTQTKVAGGREVRDPNGKAFGNAYVRALAESLPALEQGTGR